jgi:hypothetical protein
MSSFYETCGLIKCASYLNSSDILQYLLISCCNYAREAEFTKAGNRTIRSEIHKLTHSKWNRVELPQELESIIAPVCKEANKIDGNNC